MRLPDDRPEPGRANCSRETRDRIAPGGYIGALARTPITPPWSRRRGEEEGTMKLHVLEREIRLPIPVAQAWEFFSDPRNLSRITPADMGFKVTSRLPSGCTRG
jgi:hypothetical protein